MIEFDRVSFSYGTRGILKDVSFSINADERVAIFGESGGGKTTVLKLILGLIRPDAGGIIIDEMEINDKTEDELRPIRMKFSVVFQEGALFDSLSVKENVAFYLREYTRMSEEEINQKVKELLRMVGLEHAMEMIPEELSGGMHRRVAIARSLAAFESKMFLYDEPTAGLDPANSDIICGLIHDLSKNGKGFVIITQKVTDAIKVADRFMVLKEGMIIFDGQKEQFIRTTLPELRIFLSELNLILKDR
jgi:phospholipid/cholesterol/gamma-HCH transport system ATP-binding protein